MTCCFGIMSKWIAAPRYGYLLAIVIQCGLTSTTAWEGSCQEHPWTKQTYSLSLEALHIGQLIGMSRSFEVV